MKPEAADHVLTEQERDQFERDGYLIIEDALEPDHVHRLKEAVDRVAAAERDEHQIPPDKRVRVNDFTSRDEAFMDLVDWYRTFPKVWGILGWNIQLYAATLKVTPARDEVQEGGEPKMGWHQDTSRLNIELETSPRPRISMKIAYFLSDCSEPGRGNLYVIPGSHETNSIDFGNGDRKSEVEGAFRYWYPKAAPCCSIAACGTRPAATTGPARALSWFYGYSYRWFRPRDDQTAGRFWDGFDPIRHQLFGASTTAKGYTSPTAEDAPLREWICEHLGEGAVMG